MNAVFVSAIVVVFLAAYSYGQQDCGVPPPPPCVYPDGCKEPQKVGPCNTIVLRYYFNPVTKKCEQFKWGGCCPNCNNFATLQECQRTCVR
ncbi:kunitz-like toxin PcKuz1 [Amblyomma americanum]|uniref:BPTI/Kunitz inhibitor domain-containing protein n=1 Tax=Amblyomma americanum TaxID=6943 RepID=A0AAQ4F3H9_AMBAM